MIKHPSSFRDPDGYIFEENGELLRFISANYVPLYNRFMDSGLYAKLLEKRLIIAHKKADRNTPNGIIIKPKKIPFVSYPYEWCFEQYRDAALTTLKIQLLALNYSMSLKDASSYNIQFLNGYSVFIDTLSFEEYEDNKPWIAYGQFCRHFLAPLLLMSKIDENLSKLMASFIDGIPLDLASNLLKRKCSPFIYMHIHLHAKMINKHGNSKNNKEANVSKAKQIALVKSLISYIEKLKIKTKSSEWGEYYSITNYTVESAIHKEEIVSNFLDRCGNIKHVWDFGANDGRYSKLATKKDAHVVAFDIDKNAVRSNYLEVRESHQKMLPLILDLTAPSPAIGFANSERQSLKERQKPDVIMALALIHHLAISNNLPLSKIAEWLSSLTTHLIIEFVPKSDSQVQTLLVTRKDIFNEYDENNFEKDFKQFFCLKEKTKVKDSNRIIYLFTALK